MLFSMMCLFHQKWCITTLSFPSLFFLLFIHLCGMFLVRVISISCSFVIISFCSFPQLQFCLLSCTQSNQHWSSLPLNLCITNFYIFAWCYGVSACHWLLHFCQCIYLGRAGHWLLHFCWCCKYVVGKRPGPNLGINGYVSETRVIMWFRHLHGCIIPGFLCCTQEWPMEIYLCTSETNVSLMSETQWSTRSNYIYCHFLTNWYLSGSHNMSPCTCFFSKFTVCVDITD